MHRTGTSLVANLLHNALGVPMGRRFLGPGPWNRAGVWEDIAFVMINKRILMAAGGPKGTAWKHPPDKAEIDKVISISGHVEQLVRSHSGVWGWKDPRTCLTIQHYAPYLVHPLYVVTERDSKEMLRSLEKRGPRKGDTFWNKLIARYEGDRDRFLEASGAEVVRVRFERLVGKRSWQAEVDKLAAAVGATYDPDKVKGIIQWR